MQVGTLQQEFPGTVSCHHMDYLEDARMPTPSPHSHVENTNTTNHADTPAASSPSSKAIVAIPQVTLLYKLVDGIAPRSFGLNVARLARLPEGVVQRAAQVSAQLEHGEKQEEQDLVAQLRTAVARGDAARVLELHTTLV